MHLIDYPKFCPSRTGAAARARELFITWKLASPSAAMARLPAATSRGTRGRRGPMPTFGGPARIPYFDRCGRAPRGPREEVGDDYEKFGAHKSAPTTIPLASHYLYLTAPL